MAPWPLTGVKKGAVAAATLVLFAGVFALLPNPWRRMERGPIDINLGHGLADCPWPAGVDKLDPVGSLRIEDRDVILRTDERVYFEGPVHALNCLSAYTAGPVIMLELPSGGADAAGDASPPALDPTIDRTHDDPDAALAAYRRARGVVDGFGLPLDEASQARKSLDAWYAGDHDSRGGTGLGRVGPLTSGGLEIGLNRGADVLLTFAFWTEPPLTSWNGAGRRTICIRTHVEGAPDWYQPPTYSDAEIARSPFKLCPPSRW